MLREWRPWLFQADAKLLIFLILSMSVFSIKLPCMCFRYTWLWCPMVYISHISKNKKNIPPNNKLSLEMRFFFPLQHQCWSLTAPLVFSHSVSEFACHISGCSAVHSTLEEYEHHYNSLHRHVCCSCRRSLPTARLLDIHIQEWHDSLFMILAQRQDMVS